MHIANPIYDVVFKYLMEDNAIAKMLISSIIEQEVLSLAFHPQENTLELAEQSLTVYRLDFAARIQTPEGEKSVLIEIQKSQLPADCMRFLRNAVFSESNSGDSDKSLPIITVYFLGHELNLFKRPVIQVLRQCRDGITKELLTGRDDFIENLTHDCYIIQIPYLHQKRRTELETLLSVFDQGNLTEDHHILNVNEEDFPEKFRPLIRRLQHAIAEPKVRKSMEIEDEIFTLLQNKERQIARKEEIIQEQYKVIEEKDRALAESKKIIEELRAKLQ